MKYFERDKKNADEQVLTYKVILPEKVHRKKREKTPV